MQQNTFYDKCHLFVAAIRIIEHQTGAPPSLDQIIEMLSFSNETCHLISKRLEENQTVEVIEGAFGIRFAVKEHLKLEDIARDENCNTLAEELKKFRTNRSQLSQKIETFKAKQTQKQKDLFAEIEKKLKKDLEKK